MKTQPRSPVAAFTLIELMVVIGIVAVLATLVFTVAGRAQSKGDQARDISNLRQVGAAVLTFAGENNGLTPTAGSTILYGQIDAVTQLPPWTQQIETYLQGDRQVLSSSKKPNADGEYRVDYFLGSRAAYLAAEEEDEDVLFQPVHLLKIANTSKYVLLGKNAAITFAEGDADPDNYTQDPAFGDGDSSEKVPLFFADGHVTLLSHYDPEVMTTTYEGTETSFEAD